MDSPPTSDIFSDDMDSISIREKSLLNKSVSKYNNSFKDSYFPEHNLKPIRRGRKTFAFWTLVGLLFILAIGNLLITTLILAVLKLGQGMESIEVVDEEGVVKFFGKIDLDHIYKRDGKLEGYEGDSVIITSEDSAISLNLNSKTGKVITKLRLDKNETVFKGINVFDIKNERNISIFTVNEPIFNLYRGKNLKAPRIQTSKVRSSSAENLQIEGDRVYIKGAEGTAMEGREIVWNTGEDIYLSSNGGSILLSGQEGTFIDLKRIPVAKMNSNNYISPQFKVCVCVPGGKLFRIPVVNSNNRVYCNHINGHHNPCF